MDYIIIAMLFILIVINFILLIKQLKNNSKERIISELKISLSENNFNLIDSVNRKISESEQKQLRELLTNKLETVERMDRNSNKLTESFVKFSTETSKTLNDNFTSLNERVSQNLDRINLRVEERLNEGFEKTNKTFINILERLSKIDEAQKKIDSLSTNIVSLQDVLTDKKSRGTFGEVQLNHILSVVFGEKNDKIYEVQKKLENSMIADAVLYIPEPVGMLCIDSKFPLENYQRMIDINNSEIERKQYSRDFKSNVKTHINDISSKYIIQGQTSDQAIMFIPAEAIFAEINAYHQDILDYAGEKRVWITSPTTLMSVLSTVQVVLRNIEREKYAGIIHEELNKLGKEFKLYKDRWESLAKNIKRVSDDVDKINITSNKIERKFDKISKVEMSSEPELEEIEYSEV
ncbi:MAG: DNA recombination protein RmuC [Tissierellia bacterium]|nr:DNA recombination protein RmuC [Tissierellia bacterium]MDD3226727.1 DNA recombination protein RmuC [Tissierellia bacterium]MDD3750622.1 DNA recombination protein RmuC [Tissierellia bacterium]MDD4046433.1 DNA recombination protein RmuC [Tissierellia bacterium]MDD4678006.1 DNA recombination protein RmuC [Tissierellia bacterium]